MKYGAHCYIFTDRWADDQLHVLDMAGELGLDMVELSVGDDVHFTPALTAARARALGLELVIGPGGHWPMECDLSSDTPSERKLGLTWHKRQVDLAAELGAIAYAGALYGHPGIIKRRRPPAEEYVHTAAGLHELAGYADRQGVAIVLEPMSHFRTHLVNRPEQLARLIQLADHDNLFALLDTYHVVTEIRDYAEAVRTLAPYLWALHACENDRGVPGGGLVPWETLFATLAEVGFDGTIAMEAYNSSIEDFAYQRAMFHDVCPDGRLFVEEGLNFLRRLETRYFGNGSDAR